MDVKSVAKHVAWPLGVVAAYQWGLLNWIPGFSGPKAEKPLGAFIK